MPLALIRDRSIASLVVARLVGNTGDGFGALALSFGVLRLGYGPGGLSLVIACTTLPKLLVPAGGVIGDRFQRHRVMAAAETLAALAWTGLAACFLAGAAPLATLCGLALAAGLARAVLLPAERGIVADLVDGPARQVANALLGQTVAAGLLIGLGTAGILVAAVGPGWAAAVKAGTSGAGAILLARLRAPQVERAPTRMLADLRGGWREFTAYPWVWTLTAQFTALAVAAGAFTTVIGPVYMERGHGGPGAWGTVAAAEALGALLGGLLAVWWRPVHPVLVLAVLPVTSAAPMLLTAAGAPWTTLAVAMLIPGACQTIYGVLWCTTVQATFPPGVLARVNSWNVLGAFALTPAAALAAGSLITTIGTPATATVAALLVIATTTAALLSPPIRHAPRGGGVGQAGRPYRSWRGGRSGDG